jgi:2-keto-4-pentenoate hydratase/2-oxohepta-3-ene-1,7-dioic acid hydratase in catechol pathway
MTIAPGPLTPRPTVTMRFILPLPGSAVPCMRLITFEDSVRRSRLGALVPDGRIVDLNSACALYLRDAEDEGAFYRLADALVPPNMRELFSGGDTSLEAARKALDHALGSDNLFAPRGEPIFYSADEVILKTPIVPRKFFHAAGFQNVDAIVGHDEPVIYPEHLTQELDCEIGLALVLKKSGKHFPPDEAADYIGGYLIFNDITARDIQRREMKSGILGLCKGIDTFCPLGPWIVTADEIPDPQKLAMQLRVNGELRQDSPSRKMSLNIPGILSRYSPMGYAAGDVVSTAPASGGDATAGHLKVGDVMECEIEGIGILRNRIISWEEAFGRKAAALQETFPL